ncbi:MAG: hypothetical protein BVN33_14755 [Proteobacteria bacterium ST_bin13]|nr:MAG: hypothetical protein BVN33_14755 [Proteobacteria bacterium ST_bin13]
MAQLIGLPRFARHREQAVSTDDRRLSRIIVIQQALQGLTYDEAQFVLQTVHRNMELNDELRRVTDGREE